MNMKMSDGIKLKPCPFCGSRNVYVEQIGSGGYFNVCCCNCLANVPLSGSRETAVNVWNRGSIDRDTLLRIAEDLEADYFAGSEWYEPSTVSIEEVLKFERKMAAQIRKAVNDDEHEND